MSDTSLGIGVYNTVEAARLLKLPSRKTRRWIAGYSYSHSGEIHHQKPLWHPQLPAHDGLRTIGFLDLMQLRAVARLLELGFSMQFARLALRRAADVISSEHPFVTSKFRTDGRHIFLELAEKLDILNEPRLLDLKSGQWVMREIIDRTFVDVDVENDLVRRWWPLGKGRSVVLDPRRRFGRPIVSRAGVPVRTLIEAFDREGSAVEVARWYQVGGDEVGDALEMRDRIAH